MVKQDRGELENVVSGIDGVTSNNTSTDYTGRSLECCSIRGHNGASKDLNLRIWSAFFMDSDVWWHVEFFHETRSLRRNVNAKQQRHVYTEFVVGK